ncbi:hypothetical protein BV898_10250 [Hypsibius exemplaris]|uniref:Invertebrate defensins family profile domain-containing protein n=1 Tax=Hypsibius exemplaris TaxID=2072580 RepID=A0A1W0WKK6_HYPEX|nr:hypothetical protein BV898_10250 [Hypsibius exemplaris]
MKTAIILAVLLTLALFSITADGAVALNRSKRDSLKGSCVWGAVDYKSDCLGECKRMGYKGGHCGSFANVNCWCET